MRYKILEIYEADFGCEERPEGQETMVQVKLQSEEGDIQCMLVPDRRLYELGVDEGDEVLLFTGDLQIVTYLAI